LFVEESVSSSIISDQEIKDNPWSLVVFAGKVQTNRIKESPHCLSSLILNAFGMEHHVGVICDECSESPILGTRYTSKIVYGFDLCEYCYRSQKNLDEFFAFEEPLSFHEEVSIVTCRDNHITACTAEQAKEQLQEFEGGPSHVAYFHFFETTCPAKATQNAGEVLAFLEDHKELTNLRFTIPFDRTVSYGGIVELLAKGFARLKHVKQVDWSISGNWHTDDAEFPAAPAVAALGNLIAENTTLEGIFIHMPCEAEDAVELIRRLEFNKTLKNFRLEVRYHDNVISNEKFHTTAFRILDDHPSLKKVFLNDRYNPKDTQNQCFQVDLRWSNISRISGWNVRWCNPNLSDVERIETLQEIETASNDFPVAASLSGLYQVIRRHPQSWQCSRNEETLELS
jgi:hypothetical protein